MALFRNLCGGSNKHDNENANIVVLPVSMFSPNGKLLSHKLVLQLDEHQVNVQKQRGKCVVKSLGIAELQDVIAGQLPKALQSKSANLPKNSVQPDCCVSLIANKTDDVVELVARTRDVAQNLVSLLKRMQRDYKSSVKDKLDDWIAMYFSQADASGNGSLSLDEITRLVKSLGCNLKQEEIRNRFNAANKNADDALNVDEFRSFFNDLLALNEIDSTFAKFGGGDAFLDFGEFKAYLNNGLHLAQPVVADSMRRFEEILSAYERSDEARKRNLLTLNGFRLMYISGCPLVSVLNEQCSTVYQDMTRPLTDYWFETSHNTFLEGHQVLGSASADAYRHALRLGCRSIELDLWDGRDEPIVTHGYTIVNHVPLSDIFQAINDTAFESSPYPVILSLENHLSIEYQKMAASMAIRIFGDKLYRTKQQPGAKLPSPDQLKYKIVLKAKALSEDGSVPVEDDKPPAEPVEGKPKKAKETATVAREFSDLIVLCKSYPFKGFDSAFSVQQPNQLSSLSENKIRKLLSTDAQNLVRYTNNFLVRIYPKGTRFDSCNFDPVPMWNVGCQSVAYNVQKRDLAFSMCRAMFSDNGRCGYVLKPSILRDGTPEAPIELNVRIISGFQLPLVQSHIDPVVTVCVSGETGDETRQTTSVVHRNSFHPVWNASFKFKINTPSLSFIRFLVHDDDDSEKRVCAQNAFRVINLANGFRALPLLDSDHNLDDKAFLFVDIWSRPYSAT